MDGSLAFASAVLLFGAFDPVVDPGLAPKSSMAVGFAVQRFQDDFGLFVRVDSPRFLDDRLAVVLGGGIGWYPDLRSLPSSVDEQDFGAWSMYGHARLCLEFSAMIAGSPHRLYATMGPSVLMLSSQVSTTRLAPGVFGALGVELFAGDAFRAYPLAFFAEIGAVAHSASANVESRVGVPAETEDKTVDRLIATGLALSGGVRIYLSD